VWTVNASNVEWVECEHINKSGTIVQLEAQIHQMRCKLETLQKKKQTNIHQLESSLENLTNKLSKEMNNCKFKLKPQSFTTKVSVKKLTHQINKKSSNVKQHKFQPIPTMQVQASNYRVYQKMLLL
jgi:hypothetical protein